MKKALLVTEASVYRDKDGKFVAKGGGEMCFHNIARSLLKIGIEPVVFAISEFDEQVEEEIIDGVLYRRMNVKSRSSFKILKYLRSVVKESGEYDFVFLNQFTPHLALPWLKGMKIGVVHDVYQERGIRFWISQYGFFKGLMGNLVEKLQLKFDFKYADKIMTVSDFSQEKIEAFMGDRVVCKIYKNAFPVNINNFHSDMEKENYLLFVGRFVDYKNPDHVLYALRTVKKVFPQFKAVFVLPRVEKKVLDSFFKRRVELGLKEEDVILRDNCSEEDMRILFAKAKLFVQPSYVEGQGIVVLEALASRAPVVAYNLPAYKGMLVNGKNCILVEKGNIEVFERACLDVLREYESYYRECHTYLDDFSEENFNYVMEQICSNASRVF